MALNPALTDITPYGMGLTVSRLAEHLGVSRRAVRVVHYPPNPNTLELWALRPGQDGSPGELMTYLGSFSPDFTRADPYDRKLIIEALGGAQHGS